MKLLGVIPARGGSKRLPRKNIRQFLDKPLIAWTIEVAKKSGALERLIVLTDDQKTAGIARQYGAEVLMEPAELAADSAYIADALRYAVQKLRADFGYDSPAFVLLEPSAVGREPRHIQEAIAIINERRDIDSLLGISETPAHFSFLKQFHIYDKNIIKRVNDGAILKQITHLNQNVPKSHYANSAIYAFRTKNLFTGDKNLWGENTYGYVMDGSALADIDTEEDWQIAEIKMKRKLGIL